MRLDRCSRLVLSCGFAAVIASVAAGQTWNAAVDLRANELNGSAAEESNPNATVPEWSYGFHGLGAVALTLYNTHSNSVLGDPDNQGWITPGGTFGIPFIYVDVSVPVPTALAMHPFSGTTDLLSYNVVRFTAPTSGIYNVSAFWQDADAQIGNSSDDGAAADVVLNGVAQPGFVGSNVFGAGGMATYLNSFNLTAGDKLDFELNSGPAGNNFADSTNFNAIITAVPEPASLALLVVGLAACCRRR